MKNNQLEDPEEQNSDSDEEEEDLEWSNWNQFDWLTGMVLARLLYL